MMIRKGAVSLVMLAVIATGGCKSTARHQPTRHVLSGEFPSITLLPVEQARHVTVATFARRDGELDAKDWSAIVGIISRIPDADVLSEREIMDIKVFNPYRPTVAVQIQLPAVEVIFVKMGPEEWIIAGLYMYNT